MKLVSNLFIQDFTLSNLNQNSLGIFQHRYIHDAG